MKWKTICEIDSIDELKRVFSRKNILRNICLYRLNSIRKWIWLCKWLEHCRIRNRIVVNFSILVFVAGMISYFCTYNLKRIGNTVQEKWQINSIHLASLSDIVQRYQRVQLRIADILRLKNKEELRDYISQIKTDTGIINEELKNCSASVSTVLEKKLRDSAIESTNKYLAYLRKVEKLVLNNKFQAAREIIFGEMARIASINQNILDSWINVNVNKGVGISAN